MGISAMDLKRLASRDLLSQDNDPNIGSARGTSTDAFTSTLTVNSLIFVGITALFFVLRRYNRRVYAPLTCVPGIESWRQLKYSDKSKHGVVDVVEGLDGFSKQLGWMRNVWRLPDETVLRTNGLDGYLFLRYIRQSMMLCFVGVLMTFILFPINATGNAGQAGLDLLSLSNLGKSNDKRLYAHVLVSYIYFSFVLFVVYRELIFYVAIRQAYMHSDMYAPRSSARTILITAIPVKFRSEQALKAVFGETVEHVRVNRKNPKLDKLLKRRNYTAMKLEEAEVALIRRSCHRELRIARWGISEDGGSLFKRWFTRLKRPTHRVRWGKKVDTIEWCRAELAKLNGRVSGLQELQRSGDSGEVCNSAFVSFTSQSNAQRALRVVIHDLTIQMAPRSIGVSPSEVVWENLNTGWFERQIRVVLTTAFFAFMTMFWSIPNAFVGTLSQLEYLATYLPFLEIIQYLPDFIVGAITGLLPPLLLSLLLELVPTILRWLITLSGEASRPSIELKLQSWYFIFLVIQVFLVTTITSAASAAATQIIKDPTSITGLLAENLPKASNFYISYMLLQGLSVSSSIVLQLATLIFYKILGYFDNTPRKTWRRWSSLVDPGMGSLFPFYSNLVVVSLTYSIIAPLVLLFATPGLGLVYLAYRYNFLFVYNTKVDTKGLAYPRAWKQTLVGVYLCQGCLAGLFALKAQIGPVILELILIAITVAFQKSLTANVTTLLEHLPDVPAASHGDLEADPMFAPTTGEKEKSVIAFAERTLSSFSKTSSATLPLSRHGGGTGTWGRLLRPELYLDHRVLEKLVPRLDGPPPQLQFDEDVYQHPSVTAPQPVIWVPRDQAGVAEREMEMTRKVHPISDAGLALDKDGGFVLDMDHVVPPDWEAEELWAV